MRTLGSAGVPASAPRGALLAHVGPSYATKARDSILKTTALPDDMPISSTLTACVARARVLPSISTSRYLLLRMHQSRGRHTGD